jgi:hypothetical protein
VKWRRGLPYDKQHLLSCFELRRMLKRSRYDSFAFSLPSVTEEDLKGRSWIEKLGARVFRFLRNVPLFRWLLTAISPALLVLAKRRRNDRGQV